MNPMMTPKEQELFKQVLDRKPNQAYLEYGAGGSTVWACNNSNIASVTSVEHSIEWIEAVKKQSLQITPIFLNPTYNYKGLGVPTSDTDQEKWEQFSRCVDGLFDIILIDGRFRIACAAHVYSLLKEGGILLMHDYMETRTVYKNIEKLYNITAQVDTLISAVKIPAQDHMILWDQFKHHWI